jgi:hypothetical protein
MSVKVIVGLVLALASAMTTNLAYVREHDAAASLPELSMRRPVRSAQLLLRNPSWLTGFAMETSGFLLYATALATAPLALVQSIQAGGIGILALISARVGRRRVSRRIQAGVAISVLGLILLAVSLVNGSGQEQHGSVGDIGLWLGLSLAVALTVLALGRRVAVADGIAGGILFSIGDISTKVVTQGGLRVVFLVTLILGYAVGTGLLQVGYQSGTALTVAGLATLFTNALPIAAGTVVLNEQVPGGALGVARVVAFAAVICGAVILARPDAVPQTRSLSRTGEGECSGR